MMKERNNKRINNNRIPYKSHYWTPSGYSRASMPETYSGEEGLEEAGYEKTTDYGENLTRSASKFMSIPLTNIFWFSFMMRASSGSCLSAGRIRASLDNPTANLCPGLNCSAGEDWRRAQNFARTGRKRLRRNWRSNGPGRYTSCNPASALHGPVGNPLVGRWCQ